MPKKEKTISLEEACSKDYYEKQVEEFSKDIKRHKEELIRLGCSEEEANVLISINLSVIARENFYGNIKAIRRAEERE